MTHPASDPATSCCGGTGFADYAAVPCPNPQCAAMQTKINRTVEDMRLAAERGAVPFVHTIETPPTTPPVATQAGEAAPAVPPEAPNAPEGAQAAEEYTGRCPKCSSKRWLSVSLNGGYTRVPQCVPCGAIHPHTLGPGWRAW